MRKLSIAILLTGCLCVLFSGCRAPEEINDMTIFSGAAVDYNQDQQLYKICAEIVNPPANATETGESQLLYTNGTSFASAVNNCAMFSEKTVHWSHAKDLLLSKELAQNVGIRPILDFIVNNNQFRLSTDLLLYDQGNASEFFHTEKQDGFSQLFQVENLLNRSERVGTGQPMKAYEALNLLNTEGIQLCLPVLSISNETPYLNGMAVFRGDRLVGQLTKEETQLFSLLQELPAPYLFTLAGSDVTLQLENIKVKWLPTQTTHQLEMNLQLTADAKMASYEAIAQEDIPALEAQAEKQLALSVSALISRIQGELHSDILGTGRRIKNKFPDQWEMLKNNWDEGAFAALPILTDCNITIQIGETHL